MAAASAARARLLAGSSSGPLFRPRLRTRLVASAAAAAYKEPSLPLIAAWLRSRALWAAKLSVLAKLMEDEGAGDA